jgi:TRAP-type transport system periplasmic protein
MEKRGFIALLGSMILVLTLAAPSMAQVIKLTFTDHNPQMGWGPMHAHQPWFSKVEEATKGRVKIEPYWSQTLVKGTDAWNAVKTGIADMGWCAHGFWPDMTPLADVINLPTLGFKTGDKGSEVLWKLYEKYPEFQRQYKDVHALILHTSAPFFLVTVKKQVKTLEDLKGMKIRALGGVATDQLKALGAIPVLIPMSDTYMALDKGVIDGMSVGWEATYSFRLYEIVKYYTMVPLSGSGVDSVPMNKQKWESIPKDLQQTITGISGLEASKFWGRNFFDTAEGAVLDKVKQGNHQMTRYTPPPEELQRWIKASEPVATDWVKKTEAKGFSSAQQVLNSAMEMSKE